MEGLRPLQTSPRFLVFSQFESYHYAKRVNFQIKEMLLQKSNYNGSYIFSFLL